MSDPRKFWSCGNVLEVLYHTFTDAKFGGYRNSTAAGAAKNVEFLCVFVRHAFERQCLCARFRHEGINDFDAVVCSCAPVFNFIRLPAIGDTTMPKSKKRKNLGFIAARGRQNKPIETKFACNVAYTMGLLCASRTKFGPHR